MLLKFMKTFWLMTGVSFAMLLLLVGIYDLIKNIFKEPNDKESELPYNLDWAFNKALKLLLICFVVFGDFALSTTITLIIQTGLLKIWS